MTTLGSRRTIKARKPHRCYWCGEKIEAGKSYVGWSGVNSDGFYTTRCHTECDAAWDRSMKIDPDYYTDEVMMGDHERGLDCHLQPTGDTQ